MSFIVGPMLLLVFFGIPLYLVLVSATTVKRKAAGVIFVLLLSWIGFLVYHFVVREKSK